MGHEAGYAEEVQRTVADDGVGDAHPVRRLRVVDIGGFHAQAKIVLDARSGSIPPALTCDQSVTYTWARGRSLPGSRRPHPSPPARRAVQTGRTDAQRARAAAPHDPLRGHEAPAGAPGGGAGHHPAARALEAALPEPRPDPGPAPPLGEPV